MAINCLLSCRLYHRGHQLPEEQGPHQAGALAAAAQSPVRGQEGGDEGEV